MVTTSEYNEELVHLRKIFEKYLEELDGKSFHHIGSTAIVGKFGKPIIVGMFKKPVIDIMVITKGLLPYIPNKIIQALDKRGYTYTRPALPLKFFKSAKLLQSGFCIHIVEGKAAIDDLKKDLNFRDYCNNNEDAFNRYKEAKKSGVGMSIMEYSKNKAKVVL